jgi:phosphoglycolate phosphatase
MRYKNLIFDLDGTLTDPKNGITGSVSHALSRLGIIENDPARLLPYIGPPLARSFKDLHGLNEEQVEKAVRFYRERFSTVGLYENEVYEGIGELLGLLSELGYVLVLATSKLEHFAEKILDHFHLAEYFCFVAGSTLDGTRSEKGDVIRYALHANGYVPAQTLMIGDTKYDIEGARENGIDSVAVGYGYGDWRETLQSGPTHVCSTIVELKELLIRLAAVGAEGI